MKKRLIAITIVMSAALSLGACGSKEVKSEKNVTTTAQSESIVETDTVSDTEADDSKTGEIVDNNDMTKIPVITDKDLNYTGDIGPIKYSIDAIQVSKLTAKSDQYASLLDTEIGKEVTLVALSVTAENTSEDKINFHIDQSKLTTNTKEQVEPNYLISDYIDGEYLGQVIHSGTIMYILPNTNADDITSIKMYITRPSDSSYQFIGEDAAVELNFE